jgi:hypothetical protein
MGQSSDGAPQSGCGSALSPNQLRIRRLPVPAGPSLNLVPRRSGASNSVHPSQTVNGGIKDGIYRVAHRPKPSCSSRSSPLHTDTPSVFLPNFGCPGMSKESPVGKAQRRTSPSGGAGSRTRAAGLLQSRAHGAGRGLHCRWGGPARFCRCRAGPCTSQRPTSQDHHPRSTICLI